MSFWDFSSLWRRNSTLCAASGSAYIWCTLVRGSRNCATIFRKWKNMEIAEFYQNLAAPEKQAETPWISRDRINYEVFTVQCIKLFASLALMLSTEGLTRALMVGAPLSWCFLAVLAVLHCGVLYSETEAPYCVQRNMQQNKKNRKSWQFTLDNFIRNTIRIFPSQRIID